MTKTKSKTVKYKSQTETISTRIDSAVAARIKTVAKSLDRTPGYVYRQMIEFLDESGMIDKAINKNETTRGVEIMKTKNLTTQDRNLDSLSYGDVELYYPDYEMNQFSRQFENIRLMDQALDEQYSPEDAEGWKKFLRHMWRVSQKLHYLWSKIEQETARSPDAVINEYVNDHLNNPENEIAQLNDAVTLLKNREQLDLERMGLYNLV